MDLMLTGLRPDTRVGVSAHRGVGSFLPGQASSPPSERDARYTRGGFRASVGTTWGRSYYLLLTVVGLPFRLEFMAAGGTTSDSTAHGGALHSGPPPGFPIPPPPRRGRALLAGVGIALAIALAAAALVVSLVSAHRNTPGTATQPEATNQSASTTESDKALCQAIAPLVKESNAEAKAYTSTANGTPERDAATPGFVNQTNDWVKRAQPVLDQYSIPPRFLTRSLQRYIDDMRLFANSLRPGPSTDADRAAWNDSLVALGGPYEVCGDLGVPLW